MRILLIGNSFTGRNDLPRLVSELAAELPDPVTIETEAVLENGASLRRHLNAGRAGALIEAEKWDLVVLQEQSTLPIKNAPRYHEHVRLFAGLVQPSGTPLALYLTWARAHAPESQAALNVATQSIAAETGARVIPVGLVWEELLAASPGLPLHDKDGSHPSPLGSYLAACVFVKTLTGQAPPDWVPPQLKLDSGEAEMVRDWVKGEG